MGRLITFILLLGFIFSCKDVASLNVDDCECLDIFLDEPISGVKDYEKRTKCLEKWNFEIKNKNYKSENLGVYNDPAQFFDEKCHNQTKTSANQIDSLKSNTINAKFVNYEYIENDSYTFIDDNGKEYYFTDIPETYNLIGDNGPNKLYVNKKFNIHWITVEGEYDYPVNKITKIELIK